MNQKVSDKKVPAISIFTGTKAMFIKLVPLALEFDRRGWPYRIIDTGQHAELVMHIIEQFGLRNPDFSLAPKQKGVSTLWGGLGWMTRLMLYLLWPSEKLRRIIFHGERGIAFIHGDTVSTLLSCLIAKRSGQTVAHVEAGLRSRNFFNPFPEEIVRVLVMRMSDLLFAPSETAMKNLQSMGLSHKSHLLPGNTNIDTMRLTLARPSASIPELPEQFCLATIHRLETIYSRRRMEFVMDIILRAHRRFPLVFIMHPPTAKRLAKYRLDVRLKEAGVLTVPLMDHASFLHCLERARFVITDGGSIQEEVSYLGVPCMLLRKSTEREEGIGKNVVLTGMEEARAVDFLERFEHFRHDSAAEAVHSPSAHIASIVADPAHRQFEKGGRAR